MPRILLDTNAYTAFKTGEGSALEVVRRAELIGVPVVVLGELLGGFAAGGCEAENRLELAESLASPRVRVVPVAADTAAHYAVVYA